MLIKLALVLLIAVMILAMVGKLRTPKARPKLRNAVKCPDCGMFLIGNGNHDCKGRA